jgi:nucleotide-binding universal stress UspA family protein
MSYSSLPLSKILLPYDGSPSARMALKFVAQAGSGYETIHNLTLLHVTAGGYLARHIQNVDLRVTRLEKTKEWQRIRQSFLEKEIQPLLTQGRELLINYGIRSPIDLKIVEGKVGEQILKIAGDESYSTIVMGRRGLSPFKELFLGSVTHYVLTRAAGVTIFVVGPDQANFQPSPFFPLLLPVDGSEACLEAVRRAAILAQDWKIPSLRIILLHVVDLALLGLTFSEAADPLLDEGHQALAAARQILDQAGLKEFIHEKLVGGIPAQTIAQEAEAQQAALIVMGSVGHSALTRLVIGSVTNSVIHLVKKPAVAVVYP